MTTRQIFGTAVSIVVAMAFGFTIARAQTTSAPGPYYAHPAWDQKLPAATRFIVLSNWSNEAVLDRETGLVWQRAPDPTDQVETIAGALCLNATTGGRRGWRLPSIAEMLSLLDPSVSGPAPALPAGHPFTLNPFATPFWTATFNAAGSAFWFVDYDGAAKTTDRPNISAKVWCVRGPMNANRY